MKLIVGLGNPGIEYQFTPHNLGFLAVDRIAEHCGAQVANRRSRALTGKCSIAGQEALLAKPETYMNLSGAAVGALVAELGLEATKDLIVIYDELDLPWGTIRIRERGSAGGHNGVKSIIAALGTQEFLRIRLGIGPDFEVGDGAKYVLAQMKKAQLALAGGMLDAASAAVKVILAEGAATAMNRFNRRKDPEDSATSS
ncbi:MAG: aminoacyl-tRNA hydrolase [Candidatus Koribacter versatilis]|uniref:Peptidyl-tRNA hydrolase n=1 Tax=Candidatus Korobacter versatilis TaxID=658062 RepID=A0A932A842_9BACT|nr:aminoacyl-tRNA hydrolase [Candidatus Koribacter versatilis]